MKVNVVIIAILIVAVLAFVYFIIKRNRKDQKELEDELNQKELPTDQHPNDRI